MTGADTTTCWSRGERQSAYQSKPRFLANQASLWHFFGSSSPRVFRHEGRWGRLKLIGRSHIPECAGQVICRGVVGIESAGETDRRVQTEQIFDPQCDFHAGQREGITPFQLYVVVNHRTKDMEISCGLATRYADHHGAGARFSYRVYVTNA